MQFIEVHLLDESMIKILDQTDAHESGSIVRLLPFCQEEYPCLGYVEPYARTFFNSTQMPPILKEIERLLAANAHAEDLSGLLKLQKLATACGAQFNYWLRFEGD